MKILIVSDNASEQFGGEAALPLHYFRYLLKRDIDVQLVVHARCKSELQKCLGDDIDRVHFVPDTLLIRFLNVISQRIPQRIATLTTLALMLLLSQFMQRKIARRLVRKLGIDVVHQPTPVSPKFPSLLFALGAPVVIGPMNGAMSLPKGYGDIQSTGENVLSAVVRMATQFVNIIMPGKMLASKLLVSNERTRRALPGLSSRPCETLVENGVDLTRFQAKKITTTTPFEPDKPLRLLYLGRLVDWKGVDILIDTVASLKNKVDLELHIVGDGVKRASLQRLAKKSKAADSIFFHGHITQEKCPTLMTTMDVLVLPSLIDCGGACVLEAMSVGLPVIATKWGGPIDYIDEQCGILVDPSGGRNAFIERLREAILQIAGDTDIAQTMGSRGRRKAELQFDWEVKIDYIIDLYRQVAIDKTKKSKMRLGTGMTQTIKIG